MRVAAGFGIQNWHDWVRSRPPLSAGGMHARPTSRSSRLCQRPTANYCSAVLLLLPLATALALADTVPCASPRAVSAGFGTTFPFIPFVTANRFSSVP